MDLKNINLMNDALFKAMMCHKNNRCLVVDFLHRVTGIEKEVLEKGTEKKFPKEIFQIKSK